MARIQIEDLSPDAALTPEELERIYGAGRRSPGLIIEGLENREMYAAHLGASLTAGLLGPAAHAPTSAHARTYNPADEMQVLGMTPAGSHQAVQSTDPSSRNLANQKAALAGSLQGQLPGNRAQLGAVNPLLAPSQEAGRTTFETSYADWMKRYSRNGGDFKGMPTMRIARPDSNEDSVSEGTAYAMLMTVHSQDPKARETFDQLWRYAQLKFNSNGLMAWRINKEGSIIDQGAATDADQDMAMALHLAFKRWGWANYKADAIDLVNKIMKYEVQEGTNALLPGDRWGADGPTHINPSYFAPAYYRIFKQLSGDARWDAVREKCYDLLKRALSKSGDTGLVPDWMDQNGDVAPPINGNEYSHNYGYDAARTPWRFALDAVWYGDQRAIDYLKKIDAFFTKIGVANVKDKYQLNGQPGPGNTNHNAMAVSMAATTAVVNSDGSTRTAYWNEMVKVQEGYQWGYYNNALRCMGMLLTGGLMEKPEL